MFSPQMIIWTNEPILNYHSSSYCFASWKISEHSVILSQSPVQRKQGNILISKVWKWWFSWKMRNKQWQVEQKRAPLNRADTSLGRTMVWVYGHSRKLIRPLPCEVLHARYRGGRQSNFPKADKGPWNSAGAAQKIPALLTGQLYRMGATWVFSYEGKTCWRIHEMIFTIIQRRIDLYSIG